jgi:hypothetical protein
LSRIGLFFTDHEIIKGNIDKAKHMLEEGGDWDRRNRLKVCSCIKFSMNFHIINLQFTPIYSHGLRTALNA